MSSKEETSKPLSWQRTFFSFVCVCVRVCGEGGTYVDGLLLCKAATVESTHSVYCEG